MRGPEAQATGFGPAGQVTTLSTPLPGDGNGVVVGGTAWNNGLDVDSAVENDSNFKAIQWIGR
jgi:hypothetical protein